MTIPIKNWMGIVISLLKKVESRVPPPNIDYMVEDFKTH
jgi:hypothetical protein